MKTLLADAMKPLNVLSKFENHFAIRTVRFQVQLEADGYFSDGFRLPFQSAFIPFAPCPHGIQNRFQAIPQFRQSIFHPGRHFGVDLPGQQPAFLHLPQLSGQNLLGHMTDAKSS